MNRINTSSNLIDLSNNNNKISDKKLDLTNESVLGSETKIEKILNELREAFPVIFITEHPKDGNLFNGPYRMTSKFEQVNGKLTEIIKFFPLEESPKDLSENLLEKNKLVKQDHINFTKLTNEKNELQDKTNKLTINLKNEIKRNTSQSIVFEINVKQTLKHLNDLEKKEAKDISNFIKLIIYLLNNSLDEESTKNNDDQANNEIGTSSDGIFKIQDKKTWDKKISEFNNDNKIKKNSHKTQFISNTKINPKITPLFRPENPGDLLKLSKDIERLKKELKEKENDFVNMKNENDRKSTFITTIVNSAVKLLLELSNIHEKKPENLLSSIDPIVELLEKALQDFKNGLPKSTLSTSNSEDKN